MRIRRKPWARPELAACPFYIDEPEKLRGGWAQAFERKNPIYLELGCGKGAFLSQLAPFYRDINFIGLDIKSEMLGLAKRACEAAYEKENLNADNVLITAFDIERLPLIMAPPDRVERIYINFCNPWPKPSQQKHRLVHTKQLLLYREILADDGFIVFKTDDDGLFEAALTDYLPQAGFSAVYVTKDLHSAIDLHEAVMPVQTEHERMFSAMGIPTKLLVAVKSKIHPKADCENADGGI